MTDPSLPVRTPDVLIIGGGPAGLTAARTLAPKVPGQVLVLDREKTAGGIPRHSDHTGYGLRDLRRVMSGPAYARHLVTAAERAGATIRTEATVTDWVDDHTVEVTTPQGRLRVHAPAIILATGARERPRPARLIPGDRPRGVYTTGHLQNLVHLHHAKVGRKAVVVGGELVSWSAVLTLREAGCRTVLMTTRYASPESYAAFNLPGRTVLGVPVATRTRVTRIIGHGRLQAVEFENVDTGQRRTVECDTLVLTGDWIPDHELARWADLDIDPGTRGPVVDTALRTSRAGVFAIGNLVHAVDTADVAALDGAHVADQVLAWLADPKPPAGGVRIAADEPFRWVAPNLLRPGDPAPARRRLLLWTDELVRVPHVAVRQGGTVLAQRRLPWPASPGRVFRVPSSLLRDVDPSDGDVHVGLV
ncbi:FAD-dependent oxidoreductase [Planosporangium flavigriseum]|uniref:Oxidoreductase n=1 Tax=Planosporangium flavigriseum TaxID=373681 RepID=A0A8J3PNZ3_9ACTN|nr:FAD-dependent oxidoreductase [Planosporangium flavigriseum]NJC65453.1 FAD-dependent oxidoreductase [Planosporangium flavigriseum]GIG75859.1 oxidoreductase [Planosporangium flavigriseum]